MPVAPGTVGLAGRRRRAGNLLRQPLSAPRPRLGAGSARGGAWRHVVITASH